VGAVGHAVQEHVVEVGLDQPESPSRTTLRRVPAASVNTAEPRWGLEGSPVDLVDDERVVVHVVREFAEVDVVEVLYVGEADGSRCYGHGPRARRCCAPDRLA